MAPVGETETEIGGDETVTMALALLEVSATLCAVTVRLAGEGTLRVQCRDHSKRLSLHSNCHR